MALGVGNAIKHFNYHVWFEGAQFRNEAFVCDWRVAGALMEKITWAELIHLLGQAVLMDDGIVNCHEIIEICCDALEAK